ncbi:MAG: helix-turn-helix transcriptional regulator [Sphingomonas sp.]|nr:helix-turn-helix transcriptional regulator [Sphingomonas sp.]
MSKAEPRASADPAPLFSALGDRTRLSLLMTLSDGRRRSITTLSSDSRLTRQAVTKHLRVLEQVGLVESVRDGRESCFTCRPEPLEAARAYLDRVAAQWDDALGRLKAFVEE